MVCCGCLKSSPVKVDGKTAGRSHVTHQDRNAILDRGIKEREILGLILFWSEVFSYSVLFLWDIPVYQN